MLYLKPLLLEPTKLPNGKYSKRAELSLEQSVEKLCRATFDFCITIRRLNASYGYIVPGCNSGSSFTLTDYPDDWIEPVAVLAGPQTGEASDQIVYTTFGGLYKNYQSTKGGWGMKTRVLEKAKVVLGRK